MQTFSVLLIRVLAVYLVINPLLALGSGLMSAYSAGEYEQWRLFLINGFLPVLLIGGLLWFKASAIAQKLHEQDNPSGLALSEAGLVRAGSFLIGVYLLVQHLGSLIGRLSFVGGIDYGSLAVVILSLLLILGVGFIERLYYRFRHF
ncbi:hypothetical protein [Vreelandella sp. EE22]